MRFEQPVPGVLPYFNRSRPSGVTAEEPTCFAAKPTPYCKTTPEQVIAAADFEVRVVPDALTDLYIVAESVKSATLTLTLGTQYGSRTITVPIINLAGSLIDSEEYWCSVNTKCTRWWWSVPGNVMSGSNQFRYPLTSWVDEATGETISLRLDWVLIMEDYPPRTGIVATLTRMRKPGSDLPGVQSVVLLSGPLKKS